jgi:hypothetical protein
MSDRRNAVLKQHIDAVEEKDKGIMDSTAVQTATTTATDFTDATVPTEATGATGPTDTNILICAERLKQLELLEQKLPSLITEAIAEHQRNKLRILHERDKQNPQSVNLRVKRYNERHKDEINAKRRNKRKEEKAKRLLAEPKPISVLTSLSSNIINNVLPSATAIKKLSTKKINAYNGEKTESKIADSKSLSPSPTLEEVLTVRFDI